VLQTRDQGRQKHPCPIGWLQSPRNPGPALAGGGFEGQHLLASNCLPGELISLMLRHSASSLSKHSQNLAVWMRLWTRWAAIVAVSRSMKPTSRIGFRNCRGDRLPDIGCLARYQWCSVTRIRQGM